MNEATRCGYIAIVGRPNVGKSTLLNCILGKKVSITSPKPQTTRGQLIGIKTVDDAQFVYIDTPGLHDAEKRAMNKYMNRLASSSIGDADVIVFMIEATRWDKDDQSVLDKLQDVKVPVILVINKIDALKDKSQVLPLMEKLTAKFSFTDIVPLSAKNADNVSLLEDLLKKFLPEGPFLFPEDQVTDKSLNFQLAEIIREKLIFATDQEVPYSSMVEIENYVAGEKLIEVSAIIWVEREGQKAIVIGKKGELLKKIGTQARKEMEVLLNQKVFLRLWVKVKENWTENEKDFRDMGFE
ncbi:MAG: GTPase Era [Gammaproteobacteria bacterium]|nr:GTPase Era [Gammaproteobacteria bacterium]